MKFQLDIRERPDGTKYLYFPFMSMSDTHLGTGQSRAKRTCMMLQHTHVGTRKLDGDIIDGERLMHKPTWSMGLWHRQVMGHIFRDADQGTDTEMLPGNHESGMQGDPVVIDGVPYSHRRLQGKSLYGVKINDESFYTDPQGRVVWIAHGHGHDMELFKNPKNQERWYKVGDFALARLYQCDGAYRLIRPNTDFSFAASGKHLTKNFINEQLGIRKVIETAVDAKDCDAHLYGHTHMAGFDITPAGKMIINDGTCTEHVQAAVHDAEGNWAIIEWRRTRLIVKEPDGSEHVIPWADIGMGHVSEEPVLFDDEYTDRADRVLRLVARMWPARDRQKALEESRLIEVALSSGKVENILDIQALQDAYTRAAANLKIPIPRPNVIQKRELEAAAVDAEELHQAVA